MQRLTDKKPRAIGNLLMILMFASLGLVGLIGHDFIGASVWLSLAAAFASLGPEDTKWDAIPPRRRIVGVVLLGVSAALFGYQVGKDFATGAAPSMPVSTPVPGFHSSPVDFSLFRSATHA